MPTVSGQVRFDSLRLGVPFGFLTALAKVPVVLQDKATDKRLTVLTDSNGNYSFTNVTPGNYRIVEAYGETDGVSSPGDFTTAQVGPIPLGNDPPLSFATNPPPGTNTLDSTTPNTLNISVGLVDVPNQYFNDGPIILTPITTILDSCATLTQQNLITLADNGTYGSLDPGTPAGTSPTLPPYPTTVNGLNYTQYPVNIEDGFYTILNMGGSTSHSTWWNVSDVNTGDETGRFMLINGDIPGSVLFQETLPVTPNASYLMSAWILNILKTTGAPPQLGVLVLDANNNILYEQSLGNLIPYNPLVPEWKQIGTVINSGNNSQLTIKFISQGPAAEGNDYALDAIMFQPITVPEFVPIKSVTPSTAKVTDSVTYTVTLTNNCTSPLTNVFFKDLLPPELSFVDGSVTGGTVPLTDNPNNGFFIPDIAGNSIAIITFQATVNAMPLLNPINNTATMSYSYTPVQGGIPNSYSHISNVAPLQILPDQADLLITKSITPDPITAGQQGTYTLIVTNLGPDAAQNVSLTDTLPSAFTNPLYSTDGGNTWASWSSPLSLGTLTAGASQTILIQGTIASSATGSLQNTATVTSPTFDPNPDNNNSTITTPLLTSADVSVVKAAYPNPFVAGQQGTYTLVVANAGPSDAQNVSLADPIPLALTNPQYSTDGGRTWASWVTPLSLGTLPVGARQTVLIKGTIASTATGNLQNTATVNSTTPDPTPTNNTATVTTPIKTCREGILTITKTASTPSSSPCKSLTYAIIIRNTGECIAKNVVLYDDLTSQLQDTVYSLDSGITWKPWLGSYDLITLQGGASFKILIRGIVKPTPATQLINIAKVTGRIGDAPPQTHTASVVVSLINPTCSSCCNPGFSNDSVVWVSHYKTSCYTHAFSTWNWTKDKTQ